MNATRNPVGRWMPFLLFLLACSPGLLQGQSPRGWDEVVSRWRAEAADQGVVGSTLALLTPDGEARLETLGIADLDQRRPVDRETIYHWASITKTFTAISVLQLRDRGLLSLDDPVVRYVPELAQVYNPFGPMEDITIRHLLSHSAGFRAATWPWGSGEPWEPYEPTEWSQLVAMMPYTRIEFPPGSRFSYSNPGIIFLGRVIEAVTGDVFEAYVEKNIFRPLGMRSAYFDVTPWHLRAQRSNHYFVREGAAVAGGLDFNTGITVSNGGLNASVPDMLVYLAFLLDTGLGAGDGPGAGSGSPVLSRISLSEMWEWVVPTGQDVPGLGREGMGLSFFLYDGEQGRLVGHTGTQRAFYSFFILDPETGAGALGVFNTAGLGGEPPRTDDLRVDVRRAIVEGVFPHVFPGQEPEQP